MKVISEDKYSVKPRRVPRGQLFGVSRSVNSNVLFHPSLVRCFIMEYRMLGKTEMCASRPIIQGFMECIPQSSFSLDFIKKKNLTNWFGIYSKNVWFMFENGFELMEKWLKNDERHDF